MRLGTSDPLARLPGTHTFSTGDNGAFAFTLMLSNAGSQTVTATDITNSALAGSLPVTVTGPTVVSTGPSTNGVTPGAGPEAGGTTITIEGANLAGASVSLGGAACRNVQVNGTGTRLTCVTGAHAAGTVDVTITTGSGAYTAPRAFTYLPTGGVPPAPGGRALGGGGNPVPAPAGRA